MIKKNIRKKTILKYNFHKDESKDITKRKLFTN